MSDVLAIFGTVLVLAVVYPGLLTVCWLLFPASVERARAHIERRRGRSFWTGIAASIVVAVPILVLFALPLQAATFAAVFWLASALAFATIGATGIAAEMGRRLEQRSHADVSGATAFVRGAVALELAGAFPLVGWLIVIPLATVTAMGASVLALLGGLRRTHAVSPASSSPADLISAQA